MNDWKGRYYTRISNKLNDYHISPKAYCSVLKMFLNNKKSPIIPPFFDENRFAIDFTKKLNYLTHFLLNSALLVNNGSSNLRELLLKIDKIFFHLT